jgi:hypothetical protein
MHKKFLMEILMQKRIPGKAAIFICKILIVLTALCLFPEFLSQAHAESQFEGYQVKAAFLYNFAKFVEWPAGTFHDSASPVKICVLGKDPFGETLDSLRSKNVGSRKLIIERLRRGDSLEKCQILFISDSEKNNLSEILKGIKKWPVLTIGEMRGFVQSGGIINFISKGNQVSFEINIDAADRSKLKISSQLLQVANIFREKH